MTTKAAPKTVVDRSIVVILPDPDDTPSRRQGISAEVERQHRLYGTSLLAAATTLQRLHASTYATACTIFHRMYHRVSLTQYSVWNVALGSLLLATKVEDGPQQRTVRSLVLVVDHLYRKRRGCIPHHDDSTSNSGKVLPMSKLGPVWKEWYEVALEMENHILRELGFTVYWIPDSHPHKFLWEFLKQLFGLQQVTIVVPNGVEEKEGTQQEGEPQHHHELAQRAWNYCNDACRLDLCVHFDSEIITCAAIYLAAADFDLTLPVEPRPWWEFFVGNTTNSNNMSRGQQISTTANAILGLHEYERSNPSFKGFLPSLVPGGSFNDPGSFLWESRA